MAILPITTHAARWDLEDALRKAGVDLALLTAYDEIRDHEHATVLDTIQDEAEESFESGRRAGYDVGYADGRGDREKTAKAQAGGGAGT